MVLTMIPGYRDLFGAAPKSYAEFMAGIPSSLSIPVLAAFNAELNASLAGPQNQRRLWDLFSAGFTPEQAARMDQARSRYKREQNPLFNGGFWGNRYLVAMMMRELERNDRAQKSDLSGEDSFNLLMAYLLVVQELNDGDEQRLKRLRGLPVDENYAYRLLWEGFISQYEFTDNPHAAYSVYRLLQFCLFARETFAVRLKEYLDKFGMQTPMDFIGSFTQLALVTKEEHPEKAFRKVNLIEVKNDVDASHLVDLDVRGLLGESRSFGVNDIKTYPLFRLNEGEYIIMDEHLFLKKIYVGPFFELRKRTALKDDMGATDQASFNHYSTVISDEVLEKRCFKEIITGLNKPKHTVLYFDDGTDNCPDAYFRSGTTVFLIEFKGYVFPSVLADKPDFARIKGYLDERLIEKEGGTAKGIGQLARQLGLLDNGEFGFDKAFNEAVRHKAYSVYPIICHTDYYFAMPGVNDYLNREFRKRCALAGNSRAEVKDLTVIDLSHLFDMIHYGITFQELGQFINTYHKTVAAKKKDYHRERTDVHFLPAHAAFDEVYRTRFAPAVRKGQRHKDYIDGLVKNSEKALLSPL